MGVETPNKVLTENQIYDSLKKSKAGRNNNEWRGVPKRQGHSKVEVDCGRFLAYPR